MDNFIKVQLPTATTNIETYLESDDWSMSQKIDGHRALIRCGDRLVRAFNRQGLPKSQDLPRPVHEAFASIPGTFIFDGELLENTYYVFDLIEIPKGPIRRFPWAERQAILERISQGFSPCVKLVEQHRGSTAKNNFYDKCRQSNAEGVVFNHVDASYIGARTGRVVKHKFVSDVDCFILRKGENGKDNFVLGVYRSGEIFECGRVSALTGDGPHLEIGDVCSVTALYSTPDGKLVQPVRPMKRTDKSAEECTFDQLEHILVNKEILTNG